MATRPSKAVLDYQVRQAARKEVEKQTERIKLECERALEKVIELSNDLSDKRFNFDDIADVIKDETGLEV